MAKRPSLRPLETKSWTQIKRKTSAWPFKHPRRWDTFSFKLSDQRAHLQLGQFNPLYVTIKRKWYAVVILSIFEEKVGKVLYKKKPKIQPDIGYDFLGSKCSVDCWSTMILVSKLQSL